MWEAFDDREKSMKQVHKSYQLPHSTSLITDIGLCRKIFYRCGGPLKSEQTWVLMVAIGRSPFALQASAPISVHHIAMSTIERLALWGLESFVQGSIVKASKAGEIMKVEVSLHVYDTRSRYCRGSGISEAPGYRVNIQDDVQEFCSSSCSQDSFPGLIVTLFERWGATELMTQVSDEHRQTPWARTRFGDFEFGNVGTRFTWSARFLSVKELSVRVPVTLEQRPIEDLVVENRLLCERLAILSARSAECFVPGTMIKLSSQRGVYIDVQALDPGDVVATADGRTATVRVARCCPKSERWMVEVVTDQAKLTVTAEHRIVVVGAHGQEAGSKTAMELESGDLIKVGDRIRPVKARRMFKQQCEVVMIEVDPPDARVEVKQLPPYGIHTHFHRELTPDQLLSFFQAVPEDVVRRNMRGICPYSRA